MLYVMGMRMMVMKAGNASAACSHFIRTTFIIISAPTVMSAGPIAYGGTLAAQEKSSQPSNMSINAVHVSAARGTTQGSLTVHLPCPVYLLCPPTILRWDGTEALQL